ncbi:MAG: methyltransferase [Gammaproteobacteria bacterium]
MFTYHYAQPDKYHFSLDSVQLAEFVAKRLRSRPDLETFRVLDLCAGCGVIGFELAWHLRELRQLDFLEVQDVYTDYFHQNAKIVNRPELQLRWHLFNYDVLLGKEWEGKFDLILSNPPYFQAGDGTLSPSHFKNRCRFFLDSSFENFIQALKNSLAYGGEAYFLLRPLQQHGYDLFIETKKLLRDTDISIEKIAQIRGTDVILLKKP